MYKIVKCVELTYRLRLISCSILVKTSGACFFNAPIQLNATTNTLIPDRPVRFLLFALIVKYLDEIFPDPDALEVSILSLNIPDTSKTGPVTGLLYGHALLLIYHNFFYSLVYINVYHFTTIKI